MVPQERPLLFLSCRRQTQRGRNRGMAGLASLGQGFLGTAVHRRQDPFQEMNPRNGPKRNGASLQDGPENVHRSTETV
jgi:hypothetical protein